MSRIATRWSMVVEAHEGSANDSLSVRGSLLERYSGAAYRYLLGAVRNPDLAEELSQEFAARFLEGVFHRADPERGRFRDYLKTSLANLVNSHFREDRKKWRALPQGKAEPAVQPERPEKRPSFEQCLRAELLERTWAELKRLYPRYFSALRRRIDEPETSSRELAQHFSRQWGKSLTPEVVRKTVERARSKFADLLLKELERASEAADSKELRVELHQLDLLKYCSSALKRRADRIGK